MNILEMGRHEALLGNPVVAVMQRLVDPFVGVIEDDDPAVFDEGRPAFKGFARAVG